MAPPLDRIRVVKGDITRLAVDAIVNAGNQRLLGGGGVDGAIHRAAGPELLGACRALPEVRPGVRCPTGESRITPGFGLPARYVIHTVGPVWSGGDRDEAVQLAACYRSALALAREHGIRRIACPAISCGMYGYPPAEAARVAVTTLSAELAAGNTVEEVLLVAFDQRMAQTLQAALDEARVGGDD